MQINEIPKCELNEIYRQGDGSSIIPLAHEIKEGESCLLIFKKSKGSLVLYK